MTKGLPDEQKQQLLVKIPLARLGQPDEIASVVTFLAGDGGGYISGETIQVNGGMYMQ
jgi:3-oxoacyl-[acyl-carrier protein] reductase